MPEPIYSYPQKKGTWKYWKIASIVIILFAILSFLFIRGIFPFKGLNTQTQTSNFIGYQAVFLDNNQVYFGSIKTISGGFVDLQNVYYLQQPAAAGSTSSALSLVNLSTAVHGPDDEMFIPLTHVLFYENLSPASKVSQIIESHQGGASAD